MNTLAQLKAGQLAGSTRLDLACGLEEFPREIFTLADTLEVLNLSGNALRSLPDDLWRLRKLRILFCSDNLFTELPACLGQCEQLSMVAFKANRIKQVPAAALPPRLRWLILTHNCIEQLPDELGDCTDMQKLLLAGNRLRELPTTLARFKNLELLRIAANQLTELPDWLLTLPRLAWLAYAGNPLPEDYCTAHGTVATTEIDWQQLHLHQQLGEGASGVIQQACWQAPGQPDLEVAVKLYKGDMTSDGSPLNEMSACLAAGLHPNLIKVEGRVVGHPQQRSGLVMDLIDPGFLNLAAPPSFATCSRDVYAPGTRFTAHVALRMATGMASVGAHLHAQGIAHGDLYAHNILWNEQGESLLGDFGAASFYPQDGSVAAQALQRIEVRAFGLLLEELLERCDKVDPRLLALQQACAQPEVLARPAFAEIHRQLLGF